jgi:ABC-type multidrug transport system permease subunit
MSKKKTVYNSKYEKPKIVFAILTIFFWFLTVAIGISLIPNKKVRKLDLPLIPPTIERIIAITFFILYVASVTVIIVLVCINEGVANKERRKNSRDKYIKISIKLGILSLIFMILATLSLSMPATMHGHIFSLNIIITLVIISASFFVISFMILYTLICIVRKRESALRQENKL